MSRLILPKRFKTRDNLMTFDAQGYAAFDARGNQRGQRFEHPVRLPGYTTMDGKNTGTRTYDSTGAFLVGELERLDLTLHEPLAAVTWSRDIDLREDVSMADEVSSFTLSTFASAGGLGNGNGVGNGKSWISKETTQMPGISVDINKIPHGMNIWGQELKYTIPELESAAKIGRPIDQQKFEGMQLKHQMDIDEMIYYGDTPYGVTGLVNNSLVTNVSNLPNGASGSANWSKKSPDEILADINTALTQTWGNAAWAVMSDRILMPPAQYGYISTQKVSNAGNTSILKYILDNNILTSSQGRKLEIQPVKWCIGAGVGGTIGTTGTVDRMVVYVKDKKRVRYPMTMLQRTPVQYDGLWHKTSYFCRLGAVEVVYPEVFGYYDGL